MDNFDRYQMLRNNGATPRSIYCIGKDDGLDPITCLRMVRKVFDLSLAEAKKAAGLAEVFTQPQVVEEGSRVYWDLSTSQGTYLLREGRILSRTADQVQVLVTAQYDMKTGDPMPQSGMSGTPEVLTMPARYFQRSLLERLEKTFQFWNALARPV